MSAIARFGRLIEWVLGLGVAWMVGTSWAQGGSTPHQRKLLGVMVLGLVVLIAVRRLHRAVA